MNKKQVLWILLDLVFLIIFNTIFFLLGGVHNKASVWVVYGLYITCKCFKVGVCVLNNFEINLPYS